MRRPVPGPSDLLAALVRLIDHLPELNGMLAELPGLGRIKEVRPDSTT